MTPLKAVLQGSHRVIFKGRDAVLGLGEGNKVPGWDGSVLSNGDLCTSLRGDGNPLLTERHCGHFPPGSAGRRTSACRNEKLY